MLTNGTSTLGPVISCRPSPILSCRHSMPTKNANKVAANSFTYAIVQLSTTEESSSRPWLILCFLIRMDVNDKIKYMDNKRVIIDL